VEPIEIRTYPGRAGPVVVLHGGPGAPGSVAGLAAALAPEFEVWEPLQRRSGEVELTVDRHVADLRAVAPDVATIVGHSWGAMLGLSYAAHHPNAVRALALVGCGTYDEASRAEYQRRFEARLDDSDRARREELHVAMARARTVAERDDVFARQGEFAADVQSVDALPDSGPAPPPGDAAGHAETWNDVLRRQAHGLEPRSFDAISAPVLMLHGDEDPHPGPMIRDALLPHVAQLEYVEITLCGHEPWRERHGREPFLAALRTWLAAR
jgi:pimeloyl-ACP methyl ester carboxylesterase